MATLALNIDRIEDALAERGYVTEYTADDDYTSYRITGGSRELEILDAVSGAYFKPDHLSEAILYASIPVDATDAIGAIESEDDFLEVVGRIFETPTP